MVPDGRRIDAAGSSPARELRAAWNVWVETLAGPLVPAAVVLLGAATGVVVLNSPASAATFTLGPSNPETPVSTPVLSGTGGSTPLLDLDGLTTPLLDLDGLTTPLLDLDPAPDTHARTATPDIPRADAPAVRQEPATPVTPQGETLVVGGPDTSGLGLSQDWRVSGVGVDGGPPTGTGRTTSQGDLAALPDWGQTGPTAGLFGPESTSGSLLGQALASPGLSPETIAFGEVDADQNATYARLFSQEGLVQPLGDPSTSALIGATVSGLGSLYLKSGVPVQLQAGLLNIPPSAGQRLTAGVYGVAAGAYGSGIPPRAAQFEGVGLDPGRTYCSAVGCWDAGEVGTNWQEAAGPVGIAAALGAPFGYAAKARFGFLPGLAGAGVNATLSVAGTVAGPLLVPRTEWGLTPADGVEGLGADPLTAHSDTVARTPQGTLRKEADWHGVRRAAGETFLLNGSLGLVVAGPGPALVAGATGAVGASLAPLTQRVVAFEPDGDDSGVVTAERADTAGAPLLPGVRFSSYTSGDYKDFRFTEDVLRIRSEQLAEYERAGEALGGPHQVGITSGDPATDAAVRDNLRSLREQNPVVRHEQLLVDDDAARQDTGAPGRSSIRVLAERDGMAIYHVPADVDGALPMDVHGRPITGLFTIVNGQSVPLVEMPRDLTRRPVGAPDPSDPWWNMGPAGAVTADGRLVQPAPPMDELEERRQLQGEPGVRPPTVWQVAQGDTLWEHLAAEGIPTEQISAVIEAVRAANPELSNPDQLAAGQKITIPALFALRTEPER